MTAQVREVQRRMAHALNRPFVDALVKEDCWPLPTILDCLLLCDTDWRVLQERYWQWTKAEPRLSGIFYGGSSKPVDPVYERFLRHLRQAHRP